MSKPHRFFIINFLVTLIAFIQTGFSQSDKTTYASYKATADSIVIFYYGDSLMHYISFDSSRSYYRSLITNGGRNMAKFTEVLGFEPEMFSFLYYFKHPSFHGDTLTIGFYVDKNHRIMEGFYHGGLFDMQGRSDLKIISRSQALEVAKKSKIKKPLTKYEIELGWEEYRATTEDYKTYNLTNDIKHIVKGRIVWRVTSKFREAPEGDEEPYAQTFIIDAITGKVIGLEEPYIDWD